MYQNLNATLNGKNITVLQKKMKMIHLNKDMKHMTKVFWKKYTINNNFHANPQIV